MHSFTVYPEEYENGRTLTKDGITFSDSLVVKILIDGEDIEEVGGFSDAFIYFDELKNSIASSGSYLIFTCANGIAEDGGWEGVIVDISNDVVTWKFEYGDRNFTYTFDKNEYISEIGSVVDFIANSKLRLEPRSVIYPEGFSR